MPQSPLERVLYAGILLTFFVIGTLFAWRVPAWQAPDEPAHYNYIAQVATGELLPVIEMGDWDNDYLEALKAQDFAPSIIGDLDTVQYENHQPPLYYWVATPAYIVTDGNLFAVRMVSVVMGLIIVALSYAITVTVLPDKPHLGLAVMALVGFLPQNMHILASVNNDALAGVMIATTLLLCVKYLKGDNVPVWALGLCVGVIFITKTTVYLMAGVVPIVILMCWLQSEKRQIGQLVKHALTFGITAGLFAVLYWGRNIITYGFPDFLGLVAHDEIVVGQQRRAEFIASNGADAYWREAFFTTYNSFWGQFGWMEARLADALPPVIWVISAVLIVAVVGLLLRGFILNNDNTTERISPQIRILLTLILILAFAQYIYYNVTFVQFQGRYLFVAIIPFAFLVTLGVDTWRQWVISQSKIAKYSIVALFFSLAMLDFYLIWRVIPCAVGCL